MKEPSNLAEIPLKSAETRPRGQIYRFAGYSLDCALWQLRWGTTTLPLNRKSFDLLVCLVEARDRVVSKDELLEAVWPGQFVDENNLAQQVSLLRKVLNRHSEPVRLIETVPGRGYRLTAMVEPVLPEDVGAPHRPEIVLNTEQSITRITVQEETEEDEDEDALATGGTARVALPGARPALPQRAAVSRFRRWAVPALAAATILAVAGWFGYHWWANQNSGPPVQVVLTPLEGTTGDTTLDHALNDALRFDLGESPFVSLLPKAEVAQTLHQMRRPADEALTAATAREVCERTGSQAVLHSVLARTGAHFLLTGEAVSCVSGATLASTERTADRTEDLPATIAWLTSRLRRQLGEARGSVAHFTTPTLTAETASLDALKAASEATALGNAGKFLEAVEDDKRALALDPDFALAWFDLSIGQSNLNDDESARSSLQRAYDLRNTVDPQTQMLITGRYETAVTGDLYAALHNDQLWTEEYPRTAVAWDMLADVLQHLGDHAGAAAAEEHAAALRPDAAMAWSTLAQSRLHSGDLPGARAAADRGIAVSPDAEDVRMTLAKLALQTRDRALAEAQLAWIAGHPDAPHLRMLEAELAVSEGRFRDAERFTQEASLAYEHQESPAGAARARKIDAMELIAAGNRADGERLFHADPINPDEPTDLMALALLGDSPAAETLLGRQLQHRAENTEWRSLYAPTIRGMSLITSGHPEQALEALNAEGVLDTVDAQIDYLRGTAYLAMHDAKNAAAAFGKATAVPGFDSSFAYAGSWLGLARARSALGDRSGAMQAYHTYLTLTANADAGVTNVAAARQEVAALVQSSR